MFIKRKIETQLLNDLIAQSQLKEARLIAVDGRRRVGKTLFVENYIFNKTNSFNELNQSSLYLKFIGNPNLSLKENVIQCQANLIYALNNNVFIKNNDEINQRLNVVVKNKTYSWVDFFNILKSVNEILKEYHIITFIFFDEISWYDKKNKFIDYFSIAWNDYFYRQERMFIFLASSVNTWMKKRVLQNTTTLFNRIHLTLKLEPFSLKEIIEYVKNKLNVNNIDYLKENIIKYYLMFGGIVKYYENIDFTLSFEENIKRISNKSKFLKDEYDILFKGLYLLEEKSFHNKIINYLCKTKHASFDDVIKSLNQENPVQQKVYKTLSELEATGMIRFSKLNGQNVYMINDLFCFFYYMWIEKNKLSDFFKKDSYYNSWSGLSFEILLLNNKQILEEITDVCIDNIVLNWTDKRRKSQIDILFKNVKRKLLSFGIVECKFYNENITLSDLQVDNLMNKVNSVKNEYSKKDDLSDIFVDVYVIGLNKVKVRYDSEMNTQIHSVTIKDFV